MNNKRENFKTQPSTPLFVFLQLIEIVDFFSPQKADHLQNLP